MHELVGSATERELWLSSHFALIAPLLLHMRESTVPLESSWPSGMPRGTSPEPEAPLRIDAVDDAEELWGYLTVFVDLVAERTGEMRPPLISSGIQRWTAHELEMIVVNIVRWLSKCSYRISADSFFEEYFTTENNLVTIIRRARNKYGISKPRHRHFRPHGCPVCLEPAVQAVFGSSGIISLQCIECEAEWPREDWQSMRHEGLK